jgi:hypothetical protein
MPFQIISNFYLLLNHRSESDTSTQAFQTANDLEIRSCSNGKVIMINVNANYVKWRFVAYFKALSLPGRSNKAQSRHNSEGFWWMCITFHTTVPPDLIITRTRETTVIIIDQHSNPGRHIAKFALTNTCFHIVPHILGVQEVEVITPSKCVTVTFRSKLFWDTNHPHCIANCTQVYLKHSRIKPFQVVVLKLRHHLNHSKPTGNCTQHLL